MVLTKRYLTPPPLLEDAAFDFSVFNKLVPKFPIFLLLSDEQSNNDELLLLVLEEIILLYCVDILSVSHKKRT